MMQTNSDLPRRGIGWRECSTPGCDYREVRGTREGLFADGKFVCDPCFARGKIGGPYLSALNRMEKHGEVKRDEDGYFRAPGKYWTITCREMHILELRGCVRVDQVGESTFAVFLERR